MRNTVDSPYDSTETLPEGATATVAVVCSGIDNSFNPTEEVPATATAVTPSRRKYQREQYLKRKAEKAEEHASLIAMDRATPRVDRRVAPRSTGGSDRREYKRAQYALKKERRKLTEGMSRRMDDADTVSPDQHNYGPSSNSTNLHIGAFDPDSIVNENQFPYAKNASSSKKRKTNPQRKTGRRRGTSPGCFPTLESLDWGGCRSDDDSELKVSPLYSLKKMNPCNHCGAVRMEHEPKGFCCGMGKIVLHSPSAPVELYSLFNDFEIQAAEFRARIRAYNSAFSFTSFKATIDKDLANGKKGIYTFKAQGQIYHNLPALIPPSETRPCFFQLYFYDTLHEVQNRGSVISNAPLNSSTVGRIMDIMNDNPYSKLLRCLDDSMLDKYEICIKGDTKQDQRFSNSPGVDQVGAIWIESDNSTTAQKRDILVHSKSGDFHRVEYYYGCYDPLMYPLLFPYGESGWHQDIYKRGAGICSQNPGSGGHSAAGRHFSTVEDIFADEQPGLIAKAGKVSCREYYCYKLQMRPEERSILLDARRLLHQYIVDMYIKLETTRLNYFLFNQKRIRGDLYQGLVDCYVAGERSCKLLGNRTVLPSSFIGGPRDMKKRFMDALALVGKFGKPDLFITMTCNPEWEEIQMHLKPGQTAQDRPDLAARVFRAKFEDLKNLLFKKKHFGEVAAHVNVIEFQKRGLPHAHLLIILKSGYKITSADEFDDFVCAEIPNPDKYPELHRCVLKHMMHGPCGDYNKNNSCIVNDECKYRYPRKFCPETTQGKDSYPIYRRRENGRTAFIRNTELDNRWVVPYNPFLLTRYDCHINVEICTGITAVKYLFKYIYKGHDKVSVTILPSNGVVYINEIDEFRDARWVAAPEAVWRIFGFALNDVLPAVINLQLHLPNQHRVSFEEHESLGNVLHDDFNSMTMLTEFFTYCLVNQEEAPQLYVEFPETHTWNGQLKRWAIRRNKQVIGRINAANPAEGERYFLRVLLSHVRSPTSFNDLLSFQGNNYATFRESAEARGLLQSDNWISECLLDAISFQMPVALRRLFATVLVFCQPSNVEALWEKYQLQLGEDFMRVNGMSKEIALLETLRSIDSFLDSMGKSLRDFNMHTLYSSNIKELRRGDREINDELTILTPEEDIFLVNSLNEQQKNAFDTIISCVEQQRPAVYFVDGPGGTGKTFLYRALLATVRARNEIAIATATSGVAASILPGGRTAHSRFKISIDGDVASMCNITRQSGLAALIRKASLIIWDEAPMAKRWDIEAVDRTFRDLLNPDQTFGGKIVVFGGDFRQVLPVVPRATRAESVDASLVRSYLWPQMHHLKLSTNMRAINDASFSEFLLRVGDGQEPENSEGKIEIPPQMAIPCVSKMVPENEIIQAIYSELSSNGDSIEYITNRGILASRNDTVDRLNGRLIKMFPGEVHRYTSFDSAVDDKHGYYPEEFLNSLTPNGLPPHELVLKLNSPIMLLRNLSPSEGLCNGTRMVCKGFRRNIIDAEITLGQHAGRRVLLHRIPLYPAKSEAYPFNFVRMQFPIRLCFAMTINKAQGQTLPTVGVFLPQSVFSHGQLYVALSRGTTMSSTKVVIVKKRRDKQNGSFTKNIVYREVLTT